MPKDDKSSGWERPEKRAQPLFTAAVTGRVAAPGTAPQPKPLFTPGLIRLRVSPTVEEIAKLNPGLAQHICDAAKRLVEVSHLEEHLVAETVAKWGEDEEARNVVLTERAEKLAQCQIGDPSARRKLAAQIRVFESECETFAGKTQSRIAAGRFVIEHLRSREDIKDRMSPLQTALTARLARLVVADKKLTASILEVWELLEKLQNQ